MLQQMNRVCSASPNLGGITRESPNLGGITREEEEEEVVVTVKRSCYLFRMGATRPHASLGEVVCGIMERRRARCDHRQPSDISAERLANDRWGRSEHREC